VMGDDDPDLLHAGHYRGMTTDAANGFIACGRAPRIGPARRSASIRKARLTPAPLTCSQFSWLSPSLSTTSPSGRRRRFSACKSALTGADRGAMVTG
jgi:hypothetical protein